MPVTLETADRSAAHKTFNMAGCTVPIDGLLESMELLSGNHCTQKAPICPRVISKEGSATVSFAQASKLRLEVMQDFFTMALDAKWRYIALGFSSVYILSWLFFGTLWWGIVLLRQKASSSTVCIEKVTGWTSAVLFALETQVTIGYGGRQITENCPEAVLLLFIHVLVGSLITTGILGLVMFKLARSKNRGRTVLFSRTATLSFQDGHKELSFMIADLRDKRLYDPNVRAYVLRYKFVGAEIEVESVHPIKLTTDGRLHDTVLRLFMGVPTVVRHYLEDDSPLSLADFEPSGRSSVEIVVVFQGVVPNTGLMVETQCSYTSNDVVRRTDKLRLVLKSVKSDRHHYRLRWDNIMGSFYDKTDSL